MEKGAVASRWNPREVSLAEGINKGGKPPKGVKPSRPRVRLALGLAVGAWEGGAYHMTHR